MKNFISKTIALAVVIFIGTSLIVANSNSKRSAANANAAQTIPQTQTNHKKDHQKKNVSAKVQNQTEMKKMPMKMKKQNTPLKKKRMVVKKKSNMKNMKMDKDKMKMDDMDM